MFKNNSKRYTSKEPKIFDSARLYNYGIWLLSRRDYSKYELFTKMKKYQPEEKIIEEILTKLEKNSFLNDKRVINSVYQTYSKKESSSKIKNRLILKGIDKEDIGDFLSNNVDQNKELKSATDLLVKKFKTYNPELTKKYYNMLANKGFSWDIVSKAVSQFKDPD